MRPFIVRKKIYQSNHNYFKIAVSKSVASRAVDRNRIKRRIRSILQAIEKTCSKQYSYTIIIRPEALKLPFKDLSAELRAEFNRPS
ncbi:ribonuclease P protein component [Candidatus Jorgensenbacteria bacterium]|nr:ribonuclease P protein component [Candidatus Jorgensenbacteria bacterium]